MKRCCRKINKFLKLDVINFKQGSPSHLRSLWSSWAVFVAESHHLLLHHEVAAVKQPGTNKAHSARITLEGDSNRRSLDLRATTLPRVPQSLNGLCFIVCLTNISYIKWFLSGRSHSLPSPSGANLSGNPGRRTLGQDRVRTWFWCPVQAQGSQLRRSGPTSRYSSTWPLICVTKFQ